MDTNAGPLDLLGEVPGLGDYDGVKAWAEPTPVLGLTVWVLTLDGLERAKTASGRLKDILDIAEIQAIRSLGT